MKDILLFAFLLCLFASCQNSNQQEAEPLKRYSIDQFMDNTRFFGSSFSHDESKVLVGSDESGIINAYAINLADGERSTLTESKETVRPISYFPNDDRLLFLSDNGGDEIFHLFLRNEDGSIKELTDAEGARAVPYGWANDRKSYFIGYNKRNPKFMDVYEMDMETFELKMIYANDEGYNFGGISNDKKYMAVSKSITTNDSDLFILDLKTKKATKINETQAGNSAADFSNDSKSFYYLTDVGAEFQYLMQYDIASGKRTKVMQEDWDISYTYFSHTGKYRVSGINEDGKTAIKILDTKSNAKVDFPDLGALDISSINISRSEKWMTFYAGSSRSTSNLYLYNMESKEVKQLTESLNKEINKEDLVEAEVVRYKSFDGLDIPAIYYKPKSASMEDKSAAMVWVHGGPGGQSRVGYSALIQYLVNHDVAILMVNNRGSSGYGKTFYKMDDKNHGEADLKDCIEGKNYLASLPYIDQDQIGIIGGSYGGYMVMRALTHAPEEFKCGVNIFGVTNWLRTLKSIPPWWEAFKVALYEEMGDPAVDSVRLYNISPLFHADKITKPVMVLQGAQDPRVLQVESDEIVEAVKKNNIPVEYVLFEDEGHGFVKKENQIEAYSKILKFVDEYLKEKPDLKG